MRSLRPAALAAAALFLVPVSCTHDFDSFETGELSGGDADVGSDAAVGDGAMSDSASDGTVQGSDAGAGNIDTGLVAYYKFDETTGTSCADSSGNSQTATLNGGDGGVSGFAAGLENNAVMLSGTNEYVGVPNGIVNGLKSFSISFWINIVTNGQWARAFDFGTGTTKYLYFCPETQYATSRFAITTSGNGTGMEQRLESTPIATGSWQHIAITETGNAGVLYVNGTSVAQGTLNVSPNDIGNTTQDYIGRSEFVGNPYLNGKVDNFRIYNRALSASEVQELYTQKE